MFVEEHTKQGLTILRSPLLANLGVPHGFTTRVGGVSLPPFDSLDLTPPPHDGSRDATEVYRTNLARALEAVGCAGRRVRAAKQVHGCEVWISGDGSHDSRESPQADALVTDQPDEAVVIRVADCVPMLLAGRRRVGGFVVAAVHAGWRGVVANIAGVAVREITQRFDVDLTSMVAAIGPCISAEHFEVGPEVSEAFRQADLNQAIHRVPGQRDHINLAAALAAQLGSAGLAQEHIDTTDACTWRDAHLFYSHRRDQGVTGRQAAIIAPPR